MAQISSAVLIFFRGAQLAADLQLNLTCVIDSSIELADSVERNMAATATSTLQIINARHSIRSSRGFLLPNASARAFSIRESAKILSAVSTISSIRHFPDYSSSLPARLTKNITRAMSVETDKALSAGLPIDLRGIYSLLVTLVHNLIFLNSYEFRYYRKTLVFLRGL